AVRNQEAALALTPVERPRLVATPSLPKPASRLIGRREESRALADLLLGEARLVTVTGAGGSGKTRLALEVAASLEAEFAQRVCFVPLAPLREAELVPTTLVDKNLFSPRQDTGEGRFRMLETIRQYARARR